MDNLTHTHTTRIHLVKWMKGKIIQYDETVGPLKSGCMEITQIQSNRRGFRIIDIGSFYIFTKRSFRFPLFLVWKKKEQIIIIIMAKWFSYRAS